MSKPSASSLLWALLALSPVVFAAWLINSFGVDVPFNDQWQESGLFVLYHDGKLALEHLILQHNESRPVFPRLLFLALSLLKEWNTRTEMFCGLLLVCVSSFSLYRIHRSQFEGRPHFRWAAFVVSNLLLFSLGQYKNWILGLQLVVFIPSALLCVGLAVGAATRLPPLAKFLACGAFAFVATFSFANGMLLWIVFLPVLVVFAWPETSKRRLAVLVVGWFVAFGVTEYLFFRGFKNLHGLSPLEALNHPAKVAHYFCAWLGAPLSGDSLILATLVGFLLLVVFGNLLMAAFRHRRDPSVLRAVTPWACLAAYALITSVITTAGRARFGVDHALTVRYTTTSLFFPLAVAQLSLWFYAWRSPLRVGRSPTLVQGWAGKQLLISVAIVGSVLHLINNAQSVPRASDIYRRRVLGRACVVFRDVLPDVPIQHLIWARSDIFHRYEELLERGIVDYGSPPALDVVKQGAQGALDSFRVQAVHDHAIAYRATAWATLGDGRAPAHAILLSHEREDGSPRLFAMLEPDSGRNPDQKTQPGKFRRSGSVPRRRLGLAKKLDELLVRAWAYDSVENELYPVGDVIDVDLTPGK